MKSVRVGTCENCLQARMLIPKNFPSQLFEDTIDTWSATTCIHVGMYLVFSRSSYTGKDLLNYRIMECNQIFTSGLMRVLVKVVNNKRVSLLG